MNHADWAAALLDPALPVPGGLKAWNRSDPAQRFAVYRNNVIAGLVNSLGEALPVLRRFVGEAYFAALARVFITAHPPSTPVLAEWGDDFAPWLEGFAPAADWPFLSDLARLERARSHAFHAADAEPIGTGSLAALAAAVADPTQLPQVRLRLHPSLVVLHSRWATVSLWAAHQQNDEPETLELGEPEGVLVLRDAGGEVLVLPVSPASARFCGALLAGDTLGQALDAAPDADLAASFTLLIRHGAVLAWQAPGDRR
jgi:hypothetical protein